MTESQISSRQLGTAVNLSGRTSAQSIFDAPLVRGRQGLVRQPDFVDILINISVQLCRASCLHRRCAVAQQYAYSMPYGRTGADTSAGQLCLLSLPVSSLLLGAF